ncbi:uncharacterized protein RJT21DRAFT_21120 [Scheffersomyces amazonensis]|uniref:uncharacterized protein n=1 Tax=Scheffersomyces amazonensis TaxID=1078765 RepID=UPI00315D6F57
MSIIQRRGSSNGIDDKEEISSYEWTQDKELHLKKYVEEYSNAVIDLSQFYQRIDWVYLSRILEFPDVDFLKLKVDELYDSKYPYLYENELDVKRVAGYWKNKKTTLYREVNDIIVSLQLESFKTERDIVAPAPPQVPQVPQSSNDVGSSYISKVEVPLTTKMEMPKMTKTQRRMSLDLMHLGANTSHDSIVGLKRDTSLTKPAVISTTYVNAITKAEIAVRNKNGNQMPLISNRLRNVSQRLGFRKPSESSRTVSAPLISYAEPATRTTQRKQTQQNRTKMERRGSLFGENLPQYIKNQLKQAYETDSESNSKVSPVPPTETIKRDSNEDNGVIMKSPSRLQNLLANSQSLYAYSRDVSSSRFHNGSQTHTNESETTDRHSEFDGEENDREYISPDSLTRYNGIDDHEEVLKEIDDGDDDLVQLVVSFDNLSRVNEGENESSFHEREDDDYLFKV